MIICSRETAVSTSDGFDRGTIRGKFDSSLSTRRRLRLAAPIELLSSRGLWPVSFAAYQL